MRTWIAISKDGRTTHISAHTESDAYQQATSWAGSDLLASFCEV